MENLNYPWIACVGYTTHEMFEYLKHENADFRVYAPIDAALVNSKRTQQDEQRATEYMLRDNRISHEFRNYIADGNKEILYREMIANPQEAKNIFKSFHNCYYDYLDSIKYALEDSPALIPYPLSSDRIINFDYYIIFDQDPRDISEDFEDNELNKILLEANRERMAQILPMLPTGDNVVRITVPYNPYDKSQDVNATQDVMSAVLDACAKFRIDFDSKKLVVEHPMTEDPSPPIQLPD